MSRYERFDVRGSRERGYENRHQSPFRAPSLLEVDKPDYHRRKKAILGTGGRYFDDTETFFQVSMKAADPKPPLDDHSKSDPDSSDDGGSLREYLMKGSEWSRSASSSLPTRPSRTSPELRQKGPQSLIGIHNRETISKDNTVGDEAQMDDLLANFGRKVMGMKHQQQHEETSPEKTWERFIAGPGYDQINSPVYEVFHASNRRPRYQRTYVADSYTDSDYDEDEIIEADGRKHVHPKQSRSHENNDKINAAARYIQGPGYVTPEMSDTEEYDAKMNQAVQYIQGSRQKREREKTSKYALDKKKQGVSGWPG
ncbi:hypothetical protein FOMA001_g8919 [Fusarium oxysporum f. sp. matthiolae]|nr:hypothetical protein FOMA001_g8919 [Fusarium oxysporum f. sp. matthiolae]